MSVSFESDMKTLYEATALLTAFASAVDRGDMDALERLFVPDAVMDLPMLDGGQDREMLRGREAILARWRGERPFASRHIIGNVTAKLKGKGCIEAYSSGVGVRGPKVGGAPFLIALADYNDELEHGEDGWRFRSRTVNSVFTWAAESV